MKVYFAGATRVEEGFPELQKEVSKRLVSFHYQTPSLDKFYYETERDKYEMIILDSGAFSAWSQGAVIDIEKYAAYSAQWKDAVDVVVNLDVIPAYPGKKRIELSEIERSASEGYANYWTMINAGIPAEKLVHVFHQNEDFKWLKKMVHKDKIPYIGLSPANDRTVTEKMQWLDDCMPYVTDSDGAPIVKFHGFAVTSFELMRRYPWYSVDSSTWAVAGGRGDVFVPITKNGGVWDFTARPRKLTLSQIKGREGHIENRAMKTDGEIEKSIKKYLKEVNVPYGEQEFARVHVDYEIDKAIGERVCTNSFVANKGWELPDTGGFRTKEQLAKFNLNEDRIIEYDGPDYKYIERIKHKGIINYWKERQRLNAIFMNKFVDILHAEEPRKFDHSLRVKGFFD